MLKNKCDLAGGEDLLGSPVACLFEGFGQLGVGLDP